MKKLLVLLLVLIPITIYSQKRENRIPIEFEKSYTPLTHAIGWKYNSSLGKWIDNSNVIYNEKVPKNKSTGKPNSNLVSFIDENFISIQTRSILYNDKKYYVLVLSKWIGSYKYPTLELDWIKDKGFFGYIFTEEEFNKIRDINEEICIEAPIEVIYNYGNYTESTFLSLIQTEIDRPSTSKYLFRIMRSEEGDIRFFLPHGDFDEIIFPDRYDFSKQYFETDIDNFSRLIPK